MLKISKPKKSTLIIGSTVMSVLILGTIGFFSIKKYSAETYPGACYGDPDLQTAFSKTISTANNSVSVTETINSVTANLKQVGDNGLLLNLDPAIAQRFYNRTATPTDKAELEKALRASIKPLVYDPFSNLINNWTNTLFSSATGFSYTQKPKTGATATVRLENLGKGAAITDTTVLSKPYKIKATLVSGVPAVIGSFSFSSIGGRTNSYDSVSYSTCPYSSIKGQLTAGVNGFVGASVNYRYNAGIMTSVGASFNYSTESGSSIHLSATKAF